MTATNRMERMNSSHYRFLYILRLYATTHHGCHTPRAESRNVRIITVPEKSTGPGAAGRASSLPVPRCPSRRDSGDHVRFSRHRAAPGLAAIHVLDLRSGQGRGWKEG